MKRNLPAPAPTAKDINEAHRLARSSAETAVQHAIKCGQMLVAKKSGLDRGDFDRWIAQNCDFGRSMAYNYIKAAAKSSNALDDSSAGAAAAAAFPSIRSLLGIESKAPKTQSQPDTSAQRVKGAVMNPPESAAQGSEVGNRNTPVGVEPEQVRPPVPGPEPQKVSELEHDFMPEPEPLTAEEIAAMDEAAEHARADFADKVLAADDRLAAAGAEVQRLTRELAQMTQHRDHWMNQAGANAKFAKGLQARIARQDRELARLRGAAA